MGYLPIEHYGVIGDLHTAALVGRNGSIDWLCLPRFDSPSVFAAILDDKIGGRFQIEALGDAASRQMYVPDTNVLITRFVTPDGIVEVYDCMPIEVDELGARALAHDLVRVVHGVRGSVDLQVLCQPAFDYARARHTVEPLQHGCLFATEGEHPSRLSLLTGVPLTLTDGAAQACFTVKEGDWVGFVLEWVNGDHPSTTLPPTITLRHIVQESVDFWQRWLARSTYRGRWREQVGRSALALKLLTYAPTGAIVAAPTMGLPEAIGGPRNWDYRYSWVRDSSFIVFALMRIGFVEEAARYIDFLTTRCLDIQAGKSLQVVYRIDGSTDLAETELSHLEGYRGSGPVRLGNDAANQLQLDIFGELADSIYLYDKYGAPISYDVWQNLTWLLNWLCDHWQQPDDGVWEVRGGRQQFVFSRMMCWVAYDRALRMADKRGLPAPVPMPWHRGAEEIYLRQWRANAAQHGALFEGHSLQDLPALIRQAADYGQRMHTEPIPPDRAAFLAQQALGAAMCVTLENHGWTLDYRSPGCARAFVKGNLRVDPFEIVEKLAWEEMASFEWEDEAVELGIAGLELAAPATSVSPAG